MNKDLTVRETGEIMEGETRKMLVEQDRITESAIMNIKHNIQMAERLVTEVLEKDIDWGHVVGIQGDMTFDAGNQKIFAAFGVYPEHKVLYERQDEDVITFVMQCNAVGKRGSILSQGVGAASTREVKYKYRWVDNPTEFGYSPEEIKTLKSKKDNYGTKYQIKNPEYGDLVNTIMTMAAKRSDGDCVRGLPGVGTALKKLFDPRLRRKEPDWAGFWADMAKMGLDEAKVREILKVKSIADDWVSKGKTLDQAKKAIIDHLKSKKPSSKLPTEWTPEPTETEDPAVTKPEGKDPSSQAGASVTTKLEGKEPPEKVPGVNTTPDELIAMAKSIGVSEKDLLDQIGVKSREEIKNVPAAWRTAKAFGEYLSKQAKAK